MPATPESWRGLFQVNATDGPAGGFEDDQFDPKVIHLSNGNILIAYTSTATTGGASPGGTDIMARLYDSRGNVINSEFRLNQTNTADNERDFDIAATNNGGFVMVFMDDDITNTTETDVYVAEYDSTGTRIGSNVLVASDGTDAQTFRNPNITWDGNIAVITYESDFGNNDVDVLARTYNTSTNVLGAQQNLAVNIGSGTGAGVSGSNVAALSNGAYAAVWGNNNQATILGFNDDIQVQLFTSAGNATGPVINVNTGSNDFAQDPDIAGLTSGRFVVTWVTDGTDDSGNTGIRAQVYTNAGSAVGGNVVVSTTVAGDQLNPAVGALSDGGFVIAWYDVDTDDIHGQRFNSGGTKVGSEFNIDTNAGVLASSIAVEGMDDGRFVVTWSEGFQDGTIPVGPTTIPVFDSNIRAEIFDPRDDENSPNDYDDDQVIGTIGNDTIDVVSTDDNIFAWNGNDRIVFDFNFDITSGDTFDGGSGTDTLVFAGSPTTTYLLNQANLVSIEEIEFSGSGPAGTQVVRLAADQIGGGLSSFATIDGFTGRDDRLEVVMGTDTAVSLANLNFIQWISGEDEVLIQGDGSAEIITGSDVNDRIVGAGGNDTLNGGDGNDDIDGGTGNDTINGGTGNDLMNGGSGADAMNGGTGTDTASYAGAGSGVLVEFFAVVANSGDAAGDTYISVENLVGSSFNDSLRANDSVNRIDGGFGNDNLFGRGGNDTLNGDDGIDTLIGGAGADILNGGAGTDAASYFQSSAGLTLNLGNTAANTGEAAGDTYISIENLVGSVFSDQMTGDNGNNLLAGYLGSDFLFGGNGNDFLYGSTGLDFMNGGAGNDSMFGGNGNDTFAGGANGDTAFGGLGADTFAYTSISDSQNTAGNRDVIFDFTRAQGDKIDVSAIDAITGGADNAFTFIGTNAAFTGAGQLRYQNTTGFLEGDVNGDGIADFTVSVAGTGGFMQASDFIL